MGDQKKFARPEMADAVGARTSGCVRLIFPGLPQLEAELYLSGPDKAILHRETEAFQFLVSVGATTKGQ